MDKKLKNALKQNTLLLAALLLSLGTLAQGNRSKNFNDISRTKNDYYTQVGRDKPGYKQFKRWEWYYSTRLGPGGQMVDNFALNQEALRNSAANRTTLNARTDANTGSWSALGPTSVSSDNKGIGRINRITFHPSNVNTLYAASATGGLWITTDGGANWYSYSEGIPNMSLSGVAVNYTNTSEIYILTGDADGVDGGARGQFLYGKTSIGVLKSTDGGFTWYRTGLRWLETDGMVGYELVMHPTNPSILFVITNRGIYRTTDGGVTWTSTNTTSPFYDIEFHPTNPSIVYVSGNTTDSIVVLKSTNSGQTFIKTHGIDRLRNAYNRDAFNRSALAVSPDDAGYVYLFAGPATSENTFQGFYRSTNAGESFSLRNNSPNILSGSSIGVDSGDQENYDLAVAVSPTNSSRVACGGVRLWTSTTGGTSFNFQDDYVSSLSYYHVDIHDLAYHPLDNNRLYMCSDGGVYLSLNNGADWVSVSNNLQVTQYYKISASIGVGLGLENVIIGGTQDNGTNKRGSSGSSSFSKIQGQDGMDCYIDPDGLNSYVVSAQDGKFWYSASAGSSFDLVGTPASIGNALNTTVLGRWVTPVAEIAGGTGQFVIGYSPVVLATNIGNGNFAFTRLGWSGRSFVRTARNNASRIYIGDNGGDDNRVRTTTDKGSTWTTVLSEDNHNGVPVTDLAFNADNGAEIWLTFGGYSATKKVWYTSNSGTTWTNVTGSLPNIPINCIVFDDNNGNPAGAVYIGTDIGVFYRDNNSGDWIPFSNGLPVVEITDLEIHNTQGLLRAGTYGRGIWETSIYSNCPSTITVTTANTAIFKPYYFQASTSVASTAVHIGTGANVFYKAGTEVILSPGFTATSAGENIFEAALGPCGGGVPTRVQGNAVQRVKGVLMD